MNDLTLRSEQGGELSVVRDDRETIDGRDYLQWHAPHGMMFGIVPNAPEARKFLREALARLEQDAHRQALRAPRR